MAIVAPERVLLTVEEAAAVLAIEFWKSNPKEEEWLIEPLIPRGRQVALYSPAKQGKSLLTLDVVARAATGQRVLDRPAGEPLSIVYFDLEMTEGDIYERLEDMGYGPGSDLSHLHYYLLPNLPPLDTVEGGLAVLAIVRHHNADLVIIDTTSRVLDGPENDADTMRAYYLNTGLPLKADKRTVWRLDHAGKDLGRGQRGTSAKNDDVDLVWELTTQDDGGLRLRATHRRQSWVPEIVSLIRLEEPLRHERAAHTWPSGTAETARLLDELGMPLDHSQRRVRQQLQEAGHKVRNVVLAGAIRYRRSMVESAGITPGITLSGDVGITDGNHGEFVYGNHPRNQWESPSAASGNHDSPLRRNQIPSPPGSTANGVAAGSWNDGGDEVLEGDETQPCADCQSPIPVGYRVRCIACLDKRARSSGATCIDCGDQVRGRDKRCGPCADAAYQRSKEARIKTT